MAERLAQARESIHEGELLYREKISNKVVLAKLYHAMMYCLFALFNMRDIGKLTHADIIDRFDRDIEMTLHAARKFIKEVDDHLRVIRK